MAAVKSAPHYFSKFSGNSVSHWKSFSSCPELERRQGRASGNPYRPPEDGGGALQKPRGGGSVCVAPRYKPSGHKRRASLPASGQDGARSTKACKIGASGAKAPVGSMSLMPRLKPRPTKRFARLTVHFVQGEKPFVPRGKAGLLILVEVLGGDVVLGDFVGADRLFVGVVGVLDALDGFGFEGVSFLEQLVHAFRIGAFDVG